jgi:uncharacterized coiled-coil DUF342 family protein
MLDFQMIGAAMLIALIVLALFMWYLTREILRMENILLYYAIIYSILFITGQYQSFVIWIYEMTYHKPVPYYELWELWAVFISTAVSFPLLSYLMFMRIYLGFKNVEKRFILTEYEYAEYKMQYNLTMDRISHLVDELKSSNSEISKPIKILDDARNTSKKIIINGEFKRSNERISSISIDIDEIKSDIKELQKKADKLITDIDNLSSLLTQYSSKRPYMPIMYRIDHFENQINNIVAEIEPNGKINIGNLSDKVKYLESEYTGIEKR